jgi:hypothetical protein
VQPVLIKLLFDPEKEIEFPVLKLEEGTKTVIATNFTEEDITAGRFMLLLAFQLQYWPFEEPTLDQIASAYHKLFGVTL